MIYNLFHSHKWFWKKASHFLKHLMHHQFKLITPKWSCKGETRKSVSAGHASMHRAVGTLKHLKVLQRGIGNDDFLNPAYQNTSSGLLIAYIPLLLSCRQRQVWQYFYAFDKESFFSNWMVKKFYFRGTSYVGSKVWAPTINGMNSQPWHDLAFCLGQ